MFGRVEEVILSLKDVFLIVSSIYLNYSVCLRCSLFTGNDISLFFIEVMAISMHFYVFNDEFKEMYCVDSSIVEITSVFVSMQIF